MLRQLTDQELFDIDIIAELGLQDLPDEKKALFVQTIVTLVQKGVIAKILELLNEEERVALETLLHESGVESPEVILFIQTHVQNIEELFRNELIDVKKDLMMVQVPADV